MPGTHNALTRSSSRSKSAGNRPTDTITSRLRTSAPSDERVVIDLRSAPDPWTMPSDSRYSGAGLFAKRTLDLLVVVPSIIVLLPLMAILAIAVKRSSAGPILFRQPRIGRGGDTFRILKFRTMYPDAEARLNADEELRARYVANDFKLDLDEDPRVTPLGKVLRKTSLDELPQLFNVLTGDMSLVGQRPIVPDELEAYEHFAPAYMASIPGMTGVWQTCGRNDVVYPERAEMDAGYLENWSLAGDVKILANTIPAVLKSDGVH